MIQLLEEIISFGIKLVAVVPSIKCKVFEDNIGALELAKAPKLRPRTKYIGIQYHHFREYVAQKKIHISHVSSNEQITDIATKPLAKGQYQYLQQKLTGW